MQAWLNKLLIQWTLSALVVVSIPKANAQSDATPAAPQGAAAERAEAKKIIRQTRAENRGVRMEAKGKEGLIHDELRTKMNDLQKTHHEQRAALVKEMREKMDAASTPQEKRKVHEEYAPKLRALSDEQHAEDQNLREQMGLGKDEAREHAEQQVEANRAAAREKIKELRKK